MKINVNLDPLALFRHQSPSTTGPELAKVTSTSKLSPAAVVTVATPNVVVKPVLTPVKVPNTQSPIITASKEIQMASTPVVTEPLETVPVAPTTAAPVATTETKTQKVENFFTKFGDVLKTIFNVAANTAVDTETTIEPLLPSAYQAGYIKLVNAAAQQVAAADAKYTAIGASNVSFAVKVAEAVAVGGEGVLAIAAQCGLTITTDLPTFFSAAATVAQSLDTATLTQAPVAPTA